MASSMEIFERELDLLELRSFPLSTYMMENKTTGEKSIFKALLKFLEGLKKMIREAIEKVRKKLEKKVYDGSISAQLVLAKKVLAKYDETVTVDFVDVWEYEKVLKKSVRDLHILTKAFMAKYKSLGAGLTLTNAYTKKSNAILDKTQKKLLEITSTKKPVKVTKLIEWLEKQDKNNTNLFDFAEEYLTELEEIEKTVREMEEKAAQYAKETGMVAKPTALTDQLKNASVFVKRNMDWIGSAMVYLSSKIIRISLDISAQNEMRRAKDLETGGDRGPGSAIWSDEELDRTVALKYAEGRTDNTKNRLRASRALRSSEMMGAGAATSNFARSVLSRRNSV